MINACSSRLCSRNELGRSICVTFYLLCTHYKKNIVFQNSRCIYSDLYRKSLHVSRRSNASAMFVDINIANFECLICRDVYST